MNATNKKDQEFLQGFHVEEKLRVYYYARSLKILWADDYESLLRTNAYRQRKGEESLAKRAMRNGRVLLHAGGGSGKTSVLERLYFNATASNSEAIFLKLRDCKKLREVLAMSNVEPPIDTLQVMVNEVGNRRLDVEQVLSTGNQFLILVDGLNELQTSMADRVLQLLERVTDLRSSIGVVVADRMTIRERAKNGRWSLASLESDHEILLRDIRDNQPCERPYDTIHRFFDGWLKEELTESDVELLSEFAFLRYPNGPSLKSPGDLLELDLDSRILTLVRSRNLIVSETSGAEYFKHQIVHDYLAARYLVRKPELWTKETFHTLSPTDANFDAIALGLVILKADTEQSGQAEKFLEQLYNWDQYACAYAISRSRRFITKSVLSGSEYAVLLTIAERQWDAFNSTRNRIRNALRLVDSDQLPLVGEAKGYSDLIAHARQHHFDDPRFVEWQDIFCECENHAVEFLLEKIQSADSIVGWTATNVAKRGCIDEKIFDAVIGLLVSDPGDTVRWRCVHVLGAARTNESVDVLFERLDDDSDGWVLYGATRSLLEIALNDGVNGELRERVFSSLNSRLAELVVYERVAGEIEKCLLVDGADLHWKRCGKRLAGSIWELEKTRVGRERWKRLLNAIEYTASA